MERDRRFDPGHDEFFEGSVTVPRLREYVEGGRFDILHLVAHGGLPYDDSVLVLEDDNKLVDSVGDEDFFGIFQENKTLRLVTLMVCDSARASADSLNSSLSGSLALSRVPVVVAMSGKISIEAAKSFSPCLYRRLFCEGRIDIAINRARNDLALSLRKTSDWSIPVLFMHPADGRLWQDPWFESEPVPELDRPPEEGLYSKIERRKRAEPEVLEALPAHSSTARPHIATILTVAICLIVLALALSYIPLDSLWPEKQIEETQPSPVILQRIGDADSYVKGGGVENYKNAIAIYLEVLEELPDQYRHLPALKNAQEEYYNQHYVEAAYAYRKFFSELNLLSAEP